MKAMSELPIMPFYVGATARKIRVQIRDDDGNAVDLSSTTCKLSATLAGAYKIEAVDMTVEGGTDGWCYYMPDAAEVDDEGMYLCQVQTTAAGLIDYPEPFVLDVDDPIHYVAP